MATPLSPSITADLKWLNRSTRCKRAARALDTRQTTNQPNNQHETDCLTLSTPPYRRSPWKISKVDTRSAKKTIGTIRFDRIVLAAEIVNWWQGRQLIITMARGLVIISLLEFNWVWISNWRDFWHMPPMKKSKVGRFLKRRLRTMTNTIITCIICYCYWTVSEQTINQN